MKTRRETDSMGAIELPADSLYGASTARALENFQVSQKRFDRRFIQALGLIKSAAAIANKDLGRLPAKLANTIAKVAAEVADGGFDEHFVLDIFQTGSGTSTNMNANEVIANVVNQRLGGALGSKKPVHPNDHVNLGQSSNDVIPSALHVGAALGITQGLLPNLVGLEKSLKQKSRQFKNIIKIGRTHLQDATPITLGQEFSGYASQITHAIGRLKMALDGLLELPIGGTAVGTGINTHPKFGSSVCRLLKIKTGLKFYEATNHFEAQGAKDACVFASSALKSLALSLFKIANDLRWLASGPRAGLGELTLPELQPGSSIMPGKVNPVICESVMQIAAQVQGNDLVVSLGAQHGNFELNTMMPVLIGNLFESITLLQNGVEMFDKKCIRGITANKKRCADLVEQSLSLITNLNPLIGYDKAASLAKKAFHEGSTIRELLEVEKILPPADIKKYLDPKNMLSPK